MNNGDFVIFHTAFSIEEAKEICSILKKENIETIIKDNSLSFDPSFANNNLDNNYFALKIKKNDFEKANKILEDIAKNNINNIDDNHYLFSFSDKELIDILKKSDEWSKEDFFMAKEILNRRGKNISEKYIAKLKKERIKKIRSGQKISKVTIITVFLCAIFPFNLFFFLISIFSGLLFWKYKKTDFEGKKYYAYNLRSRKLGFYIFITSVISNIFWAILFGTKSYLHRQKNIIELIEITF